MPRGTKLDCVLFCSVIIGWHLRPHVGADRHREDFGVLVAHHSQVVGDQWRSRHQIGGTAISAAVGGDGGLVFLPSSTTSARRAHFRFGMCRVRTCKLVRSRACPCLCMHVLCTASRASATTASTSGGANFAKAVVQVPSPQLEQVGMGEELHLYCIAGAVWQLRRCACAHAMTRSEVAHDVGGACLWALERPTPTEGSVGPSLEDDHCPPRRRLGLHTPTH